MKRFMPSAGTKVRMRDGRVAIVTKVTPDGGDDRVRFENGVEKHVTAWDIDEIIGDETDEADPASAEKMEEP